MGNTLFPWPFSIAMFVYQRVLTAGSPGPHRAGRSYSFGDDRRIQLALGDTRTVGTLVGLRMREEHVMSNLDHVCRT